VEALKSAEMSHGTYEAPAEPLPKDLKMRLAGRLALVPTAGHEDVRR